MSQNDLHQKLGLLVEAPVPSIAFTDSQTQQIDFERLFEGQSDYYVLSSQTNKFKKKQIIITDPSFRYDLMPKANILSFYYQLFDEGFDISVWTGELTPVKKTEDLHASLSQVQPICHHHLEQILARKGLAKEDCYLAGMGQTNILSSHLLSADPAPIFLSTSNLKKIPEKELIDLLASIPDQPIVGLVIESITDFLNPLFVDYLLRHQV